ncbi:hypothetical protein BMF94_4010 [Rhodotorula taiwanensis]|uniref:PX domain-containing protein n=1 Tax=Rhodotorula taiwanensis TaxID=741276 RepID=A0A2S5B825_9BASI|nr:hypothetical protein BMF94_4010 [Rhodotorula taiwanensis]
MLSPMILTPSGLGGQVVGADYFSNAPRTCRRRPITPDVLRQFRSRSESRKSESASRRLSSSSSSSSSLSSSSSTSPVSAARFTRCATAAMNHYYQPQEQGFGSPSRPDSHLSSVAPRAPLPGYDRDYRPPGSATDTAGEERDAWGPTSPPRGAGSASWGSSTAGAHFPTTSTTSHQQPHLIPRGPQTIDPHTTRRVSNAASDYGAPEPPLGHGQPGPSSPSTAGPKEGFVRIRILGIDRQKRDMYIKFNAETNLPNFHHSSYRGLSRSYTEFTYLVAALGVTCPQSIVPALPLSQTSAATDEEDDRLIKAAFQKWAVRLTSDPAAIRDDELRSFIESDFGYTARTKKKSSTGFSFSRSSRLPGEIEDPLTAAKVSMARLETVFADTAKTLDRVSKSRRTAAGAVHDAGEQTNTFALAEPYAPLANGFKRLAHTLKADADLLASQSVSEQITLGDVFLYQSGNAKSAKETLSGRDAVADDHRHAVKASIQKRRNIEKLKSASSLRSDKVNEALEDLDEAQHYEETLARRLQGISTNLQPSLTRHSVDTHADLLSSLLEHARTTLIYEKQRLKEYETMRPEMRAIRRPEAGVIYHTTPAIAAPVGASTGRTGSIGSIASSGAGTLAASTYGNAVAPPQSPTPSRVGAGSVSSPLASADPLRGGGLHAPGSMAQKIEKRSIRNMASSVHVEGDKRQRVDARMAASMLANGF